MSGEGGRRSAPGSDCRRASMSPTVEPGGSVRSRASRPSASAYEAKRRTVTVMLLCLRQFRLVLVIVLVSLGHCELVERHASHHRAELLGRLENRDGARRNL